ncbi:hypothetical protein NPIL_426801 [Nephila pilipes]|uniref:Uncharacterized protein n=1 Tax=Nephila pilipes TaxID=299642 RepID=A0A8X6Q5K2_NEPPI|nr:hypothetical protein NPIL_426801 [Nephila pilipes]
MGWVWGPIYETQGFKADGFDDGLLVPLKGFRCDSNELVHEGLRVGFGPLETILWDRGPQSWYRWNRLLSPRRGRGRTSRSVP